MNNPRGGLNRRLTDYSQEVTGSSRPPLPILPVAAMGSGAALIMAVFTGTTLALTLPLFGAFAGLVFFLKYSRAGATDRLAIKAQVKMGLAAGIVATLAYDSLRLALVRIVGFNFAPLGALPLFGHLLIGKGASVEAAWLAGAAYHYLNGIAFSIAYCLALGGRNWKWGVLWALGLEGAMFAVYPGWLHLSGILEEFTIVSLSGHVAYGTVLGQVSQRYLNKVRDMGLLKAFRVRPDRP